MGAVLNAIRAAGLAMVEFSRAYRDTSADSETLWNRATTDMNGERIHAAAAVRNPHVSEDVAEWIFDTLQGWTHSLWPVIEHDQVWGFETAQRAITATLTTFTDRDEAAVRGVLFELARHACICFPDEVKADDMPGPRTMTGEDFSFAPSPEGHIDVRPEIAAFFDAAFERNWAGVDMVVSAIAKRAETVFAAMPTEEARIGAMGLFATAILFNVSRQYSILTVPDLIEGATDE